MKIKKATALLYLSILLVFLYAVLALISSADMVEVVETVVLSLPLIACIYHVSSDSVKTKAVVLSSASVLYFIITLLDCLLVDGAPAGPSVLKGLSSVFFVLPLVAVTFSSSRKISFLISALYAAVTLPGLRWTVSSYCYIYTDVADSPSFLAFMTFTALCVILTVLSELIFRTRKNYLSDFLLLSSVIFSYLSQKAEGDGNPVFSTLPFIMLLTLFIYLSREEKVRYSTERRTIVLSTLKIQEIEHLRKKKKPRVYEIPPNVPVNDTKNDEE